MRGCGGGRIYIHRVYAEHQADNRFAGESGIYSGTGCAGLRSQSAADRRCLGWAGRKGTIMENQPRLTFTRVERLDGPDRGGFGSTGK